MNNNYAVMQAIEAGIGLAAIPDYLALHNDNLVRILPMCEGPLFEAYFVYPRELRGSKRVALFRDFMVNLVRDAEGFK